MPLNWNFPAKIGPKAGRQVTWYHEFFLSALRDASNSLLNNEHLISKVYFPRLIVPIAAVMVAFVDFFITLLILVVMMAWYKFVLAGTSLLLLFFVAVASLVSLAPGLWITALNVKYLDFRFVTPFLISSELVSMSRPFWFSSNVVPDQWRLVYSLNPMIDVIDGFRWCILGEQNQLYLPGFGLSP